MMGKTHMVGGVLAGAVVSKFFYSGGLVTTGIYVGTLIGGSVLGSLLPDIDKKESTIGRKLWFISWPIYFFRLIIKLFANIFPEGKARKALEELDEDLGHRGIAHSLITWAVLTAILLIFKAYIIDFIIAATHKLLIHIPYTFHITNTAILQKSIFTFLLGTSIGMLSHIILDLLTSEGIALFSPFIDIKFKIPLFKTGGVAEILFRGCLCVAVLLITYKWIIPYVKLNKIL